MGRVRLARGATLASLVTPTPSLRSSRNPRHQRDPLSHHLHSAVPLPRAVTTTDRVVRRQCRLVRQATHHRDQEETPQALPRFALSSLPAGVEEIVLTTGFLQQPIPIVPIVIFRKNRIPQDDTISIFSHFRLRSWRSSMLRLVQICRRWGRRDDGEVIVRGSGVWAGGRARRLLSGDILLQGTDIHILRNTPDDVSTDMIGIGRTSKK